MTNTKCIGQQDKEKAKFQEVGFYPMSAAPVTKLQIAPGSLLASKTPAIIFVTAMLTREVLGAPFQILTLPVI